MSVSETIPSGIDCLLHDHIDGSAPLLEILPELYSMSGLELPEPIRNYENLSDLKRRIVDWYQNPQIDIVTKFGLVTNVMQNPDTLHLAGRQYVRVRAGQGIKYCEGTIAPHYHTRGDKKSQARSTEKEMVTSLISGIKEGEKEFPAGEYNILYTFGREVFETVGPHEGMRQLKIASECDRDYVVGFGLVCDEAKYPPHLYCDVFLEADRIGMPTDPHAGEWADLPGEDPYSEEVEKRLLENLRFAVYKMKSKRVGHGRPAWRDEKLCRYMAKHNIGLTSCPGSYLQSGLIKGPEELHLDVLLERRVPVSLHPDDDLFQPGVNRVFWTCDLVYHFTPEQIHQLKINAWNTRFGRRKEHCFSQESFTVLNRRKNMQSLA